MNQVSARLRRAVGGYGHYCPGCDELHIIPDKWQFNGDLEKPSFRPSVLTMGARSDHEGNPIFVDNAPATYRCHYYLTKGQLHFLADCSHALKATTVDLPPLPDWLQDNIFFREA